jgi:membrane dipeptidase
MLQSLDDVPKHPLEKGWHKEVENPYLFVDGCVQIWPDTDFSRLHRYGCSAYLVTSFNPHDSAERALDALANWWRIANQYPNISIALTAQDIVDAKQAGQTSLILGTQGADFLGQDLTRLEMFHRMGLRVMIPAYNARTSLADGCLEPSNSGLSRMGKKWVEECNRLGITIDCTHTSERATMDIFENTQRPVIFTHSNPKALFDNPRNITDEQMRKCAETGGVVGLTNWAPLLFKAGATSRPTLQDYVDALSYVAELVGPRHVSVGTDMSHGTYPDGDLQRGKKLGGGYADVVEGNPRSKLRNVEGFDDYGQILDLVEALKKSGFTEEDVEGILGKNLLRVFEATWQ